MVSHPMTEQLTRRQDHVRSYLKPVRLCCGACSRKQSLNLESSKSLARRASLQNIRQDQQRSVDHACHTLGQRQRADTWKSSFRMSKVTRSGVSLNRCEWRKTEGTIFEPAEICNKTFASGEALACHVLTTHLHDVNESNGKVR